MNKIQPHTFCGDLNSKLYWLPFLISGFLFVSFSELQFLADVDTCALVQNVPLSWFVEEVSVLCAELRLLRWFEHIPYCKKENLKDTERKKKRSRGC